MTFTEKGWQYIPNIITKEEAVQIEHETILCAALKNSGRLETHYDSERGNVMTYYAPPPSTFVMKRIQPTLEKALGEELIPTYWYTTTYYNKSRMNCHTDRPSCEISVTMNICGDVDWPIKLIDFTGKRREIVTPAGDGLAYFGTVIPHWRSPLRTHENDRFMQLFLHFVRKNGQYSNYAYDRNRKCLYLLSK